MQDIFCPMIHNGLNINLKENDDLGHNQCCLSTTPLEFVQQDQVIWNSDQLNDIRDKNNNNQWLPGCWQCQTLEKTGIKSFRLSMIEKFGRHPNLSGPQRIDLLFDRNCNLACRTCGPGSSTLWEKQYKEMKLPVDIVSGHDNTERIKKILQGLDLSNVGMIQFCGGETLLGNKYWEIAKWLADNIPDAKNKIELGFQTNGTQPIHSRWFDVIEKFKLVKLMISIDGVGDRFDYLRWPATWNQTVDNIMNLKQTLPGNVMFFVQECTSCLNLYHYNEVRDWVSNNFSTNREGDPVHHSTQMAIHQFLHPSNITQEYRDALAGTPMSNIVGKNWQEDPEKIKMFIERTQALDQWRSQDWKKTFPEVAEFYRRYL